MATATAMYYSKRDPLKRVARSSEYVSVVAKAKQRRLHKAFLRYHDPDNWPILRKALRQMGRSDLIGNGKMHLIPITQFSKLRYRGSRPFSTQHNGLPKNPTQKRGK